MFEDQTAPAVERPAELPNKKVIGTATRERPDPAGFTMIFLWINARFRTSSGTSIGSSIMGGKEGRLRDAVLSALGFRHRAHEHQHRHRRDHRSQSQGLRRQQ